MLDSNVLSSIRNERGMAIVETVPLLVIFVVLLSFAMGFWGLIHTASLHSIAARTYSFEAFRQRTQITYHREDGTGVNPATAINFQDKGWRYQAVNHERDQRSKFVATTRPIALGRAIANSDTTEATHNQDIYDIVTGTRNEKTSSNPAWVMVGYGICMNQTCGN